MATGLLTIVLLSLPAASIGGSIWSVGKPQGHVEIRDDFPTPAEFFAEYIQNKGGPFEGVGKPVLFRGAARDMPAYELWTDEYLREHHGSVQMDQVETEKKETRTKYPHENWSLSKFLDRYTQSEIYSTAQTPKGIADEVNLLPPMNCGGFQSKMATTVFWFSSGSTKSVIHNDGQQNFHCMFAGQKDWILWRSDERINTRAYGWVHAEEEAKTDPKFKDAYGTYVGLLDVDNVDIERFPGYDSLQWWNMTLSAGDCAYIPKKWYHYVEGTRQRSISVHVWFHSGTSFDAKSCEAMEQRGYNISEPLFRISDCSWGYEPGGKQTKCKLRKSQRSAKQKDDL